MVRRPWYDHGNFTMVVPRVARNHTTMVIMVHHSKVTMEKLPHKQPWYDHGKTTMVAPSVIYNRTAMVVDVLILPQ